MPDDLDDAIEASLSPASEMQGSPGHDDAMEAARAAALLRDRALGLTYDEIAERHQYSHRSNARQALLRALDARVADNAAHLRAIENERYEMDQRVIRAIIADPQSPPATRLRAIDTRTRSAARHARLNGLDAPLQVALSAGVEADLMDALAEAEAIFHEVTGEVVSRSDEPDRLEG